MRRSFRRCCRPLAGPLRCDWLLRTSGLFGRCWRGLETGFGTWGAALGLVFLACGVRDYFDKNRLVLLLAVTPAVLIATGTFFLQLPMQARFFFMLIGFALLIVV